MNFKSNLQNENENVIKKIRKRKQKKMEQKQSWRETFNFYNKIIFDII